MKNRKLLSFVLGLGMVCVLASCGSKGDKGDTGPQGPQGTEGNPGADAKQYYPVTFKNEDGSILDIQFVEKGQSADSDFVPDSSKEYSYEFTGWDKAVDNITAPTVVTAQYNHSKVYYGSYPQSSVGDNDLIQELNTKAGDLPTATDSKDWTDYEYYVEDTKSAIMYYQDIDYDGEGTYDYRGVYIKGYRPRSIDLESGTDSSFQYNNGYQLNTVYWFSYDPIEWDVLEVKNGDALLFANLILDSQEWYPSTNDLEFEHNNGTGYANNYELSSIRKFLNETFCNTAFNSLEKKIMNEIKVDNSLESTGDDTNPYVCENTKDNIFLLSASEVDSTYDSTNASRQAKGSDYAKAQGLYVSNNSATLGYSFWWLRSPFNGGTNYGTAVYGVDHGGLVYDVNDAYHSATGVRPAMWINL